VARDAALSSAVGRDLASPSSTAPGTVLPSPDAAGEFGEQVIIRKNAAFNPWRVDLDLQGFHTDNVALAPTKVEDYFLRAGLAVRYLNRINADWNLEFGLGQDFLRYDHFSSLNFDKTNASAGLSTRLSWLGGATALLRYDFDYLTEEGFGSQIMTSHAILTGFIKSWQLTEDQRLFVGLLSEPDLAVDPEISVRHEHGLNVGYTLKLTERITTRLTGRGAYQVSPNSGRSEWRYQARVSLLYQITDSVNVGASTGCIWNLSNKDRFDYNNQLTGAYLNLEYRF
jgi:hypothetical protein